ncbi:hypothetical protein B5M42_017090 [Paenibacillus athensensis]|uniref:Uncharacterized protein n=1 Tax=Paenibacillus athensensis TaxID=1967502 RepID=A0A4Y8PQC1_9BACL|nr:hypothetical protein [Paenibacillus athensensis]MCD1260519.1 hypothetical protein [Paenibacillus athensensis]
MSESAQRLFAPGTGLADWLDPGSVGKARQYVQPGCSGLQLELNWPTVDGPLRSFEVYQTWEPGDGQTSAAVGHLVLIPKQERLSDIEVTIQELRQQLGRLEQTSRSEIGLLSPRFALKLAESAAAPQPQKAVMPSAANIGSDQQREALRSLELIKEWFAVIRPDLIEAHKDMYVNLILEQLDQVSRQLHTT